MGLLIFLILGLIAGWLASLIMKTDSQQGTGSDIILGAVGSLVGGTVMSFLGYAGVTGFNLYSILVATLGAVILIWLGRALFSHN
jgi:uncharacterized membrane protein YeaQ/YmgE (transglycosylase-associated protein family)